MSLLSAMSNSLNTLRSIQQNISVISNNIANAQTEGYTRKAANLESVTLGTDFGGVRITSFTRSTETAVSASLNESITANSLSGTQNRYLQEMQQLLGSNVDQPRLAATTEAFATAWRNYEASPESSPIAREVVQRGKELANEIRRLASGLEAIDRKAISELRDSTASINELLKGVANLNNQIAVARGRNQPTGDYEDKRDQLINQLSQFTSIKTFERDAGGIAIYTTGGFSLLDGTARQFDCNGTAITLAGDSQDLINNFIGGNIEALRLLRAQNSSSGDYATGPIDKLRDQLEAFADQFLDTTSGSFAAAYNGATTGSGELASSFFTGTASDTNNAFSIDINSALIDGTSRLKQAAAGPVVDALISTGRTFSAGTLSLTNVSYTGMAESIIATTQQAASFVRAQAETASAQQKYYAERYQNSVGVNLDTELVQLQILQNTYQASARLISVINELYDITDRMMG